MTTIQYMHLFFACLGLSSLTSINSLDEDWYPMVFQLALAASNAAALAASL